MNTIVVSVTDIKGNTSLTWKKVIKTKDMTIVHANDPISYLNNS